VMCDLLACLRIAKVFITTRLHPAHFQGLFIAGIATLIALLTAFDSLPGSVGYADGATFIAMSLLIGCAPPSYHEICSQNSQAVYDNEADRVRAQNSRARRYGLPATLMVVQWLAKVRFYHYLCAYCQQRPYQVLHHLLPLGISSSTREPGGTTIEFSRVGFFRQTLLPRYAWVL
jgi:hypothetical protein